MKMFRFKLSIKIKKTVTFYFSREMCLEFGLNIARKNTHAPIFYSELLKCEQNRDSSVIRMRFQAQR